MHGSELFTIKRSATGLGLFAVQRIPKAKKIVEYTGPRVPNEQVEKSNGKYFFGVNKKWSIDGSRRDNLARYINHSCAPNAEAIVTGDRVWIWSRKTIKPGEEIAYDYGKEYFEGIIKDIGCKCAKCAPRKHARRNSPARKSKPDSR
ncbi:MAG: SET domain-containing protein [Pyrinomonadaceae bacterium]